jgi:hypothetical protein
MRHPLSTTPHGAASRHLTRRVRVRLPLATIEELDHLACLSHTSRQQILRQIINAALISDTPHRPTGPDPIDRLAEHSCLTHARSLELAAQSSRP